MSELTPKEIAAELDKHIIGQNDAKRAVAIALRNRWRRMQLPESLRQEITPKNILMIGPTGVGKTEDWLVHLSLKWKLPNLPKWVTSAVMWNPSFAIL